MNNFMKMAAVGLAGYLLGFYEMKYKAHKVLLEVLINSEKENAQK